MRLTLFCLMVCVSGFTIEAYATVQKHSSDYAIMENDKIRVSIDTCNSSSTFGMITSLYNKKRCATIGNNRLFSLRTGNLTAYEKTVLHCTNDTITFELGKFGTKNFTAFMEYALSSNGVFLTLKVVCSEKTDFSDGLNLDFQSSLTQLACSNHFANSIACNVDTLHTFMSAVDFDQIVQLADSTNIMTIIMRNPFHSHFAFNIPTTRNHTIYILQCSPAPTVTGSPNAYSTIDANDTIFRQIEVNIDSGIITPVFFGEQPDGFSNTIAMFWDELPNSDNWAYMTTDTETDTKYMHFFAKLLKEDTAIKMGFLLIPDRILAPTYTTFKNWTVNSPYIISDTFEKNSGNYSLLMLSDSLRSRVAYQKVACLPNTAYSLTYYIKTDNIIGNGVYSEVYADTHWIAAGPHLLGDNSWQISGFNFKTSKNDTSLSVYIRIQDSKGNAFFDDVKLSYLGNDSNLLSNSGFETNSGGIRYDNSRRHWSDAHGAEHIVDVAPKPYIDFLKRIENHTLLYGWEDRVELGSHGYHHSPSLFEPDPMHEFYYYDPYGDSLRINRIFSEYKQLGLTNASLRFMRSPGFDFSKSLLDILIDKGFVYFDVSYVGGLPFTSYMLQRGQNQMWLVRNAWWADYDTSGEAITRIVSVLDQGHFGAIGGHPGNVFYKATEKSYQRLKGILSSFEASYTNLGYIFPDAYADNAKSIYKLYVNGTERLDKDIIFRFHGATDSGNTVVYIGTCDNVLLNGKAVSYKIYQGSTYVVLPKNQVAFDTLLFQNAIDQQLSGKIRKQQKKLIFSNNILDPDRLAQIYNMRGQKICMVQERLLNNATPFHVKAGLYLSSGVYIIKRTDLNGKTKNQFMVIP